MSRFLLLVLREIWYIIHKNMYLNTRGGLNDKKRTADEWCDNKKVKCT